MHKPRVVSPEYADSAPHRSHPVAVIHYTIYLEDGHTFSSHQTGQPFRFEMHAGQVIPGLQTVIEHMEVGDTQRVHLSPEQAFGEHDPSRLIEADLQSVHSPTELYRGLPVRLSLGRRKVQAFVRERRSHTVVFDLNHPLAGQPITMDVTLLGFE